jgi:sugar phosphate permease
MSTAAALAKDNLRTWRARILVSTWLAYAGFYFCRKAFYSRARRAG